jgi:hypothetical protein
MQPQVRAKTVSRTRKRPTTETFTPWSNPPQVAAEAEEWCCPIQPEAVRIEEKLCRCCCFAHLCGRP